MSCAVAQKFKDKILTHLKVEDINDIELSPNLSGPQDSLLANAPVRFTDVYELHDVLGAGGFGIVCEVTCLKTSR